MRKNLLYSLVLIEVINEIAKKGIFFKLIFILIKEKKVPILLVVRISQNLVGLRLEYA